MLSVEIARAEALFVGTLPTGYMPNRDEADRSIQSAVRTHAGIKGCTADVAYEYGDHPELAAARMRWALTVVADTYRRPVRNERTFRSPR